MDFDFEYGENERLKNIVEKWLNKDCYGGYVVQGKSGTGKTCF